MIALIQRVAGAHVSVENEIVGAIGPGLLALVAVQPQDGETQTRRMLERLLGYRVFADEAGSGHARVVRAFCPADAASVPEDPVTGSANALIGAWLRQRNALPGVEGRYIASQGREVGRDGRVHVEVDAQGTVWIGGQVQPVIDGRVRW